MPQIDSFEWWKRRIETLKGFKEEAAQLYEVTKTAYEPGPWTILKLAILTYYVDVYTSIIKKNFGQAYYLDAFAGPGLDRIRETGDIIFGSPLIADRIPNENKKFDKLVLIEKNRSYASALSQLLPKACIIQDDINSDGLNQALKEIPSDAPILAFIDPEGFELEWNTLKSILDRWSDAIILFQLSQVPRTAASKICEDTMNRFYGTSDWQSCRHPKQYLECYLSKIGKHKDRIIPIRVRGEGGFYYYVIVAVRQTSGAQRWIRSIERAQLEVEKVTSSQIKRLLGIFKGEQKTLKSFMK